MKKFRWLFFLISILFLFGLTYIFRWNTYYLFTNPYFIALSFALILCLSVLSGIKLKVSILVTFLILFLLFSFSLYLLKLEKNREVPFSESIIERIKGEEKEFHSYLTLTSGKLKIGATVGENLFIFDYYAPVKLFHKYLIKNGISLFTVKEVGFFENDYERNEWELYINKGVNSKIFVRGKVLKGDINLLEIPVKEIKIKGKALHLNMKLGKKESIVKVDIDSVSFMGKIEIPPDFYVEVRFSTPYTLFDGKNFKKIGKGVYAKEGGNGRIYISVKGKGTILTIEEENHD